MQLKKITWLVTGFIIISASFMRQVLNFLQNLSSYNTVIWLLWFCFFVAGFFLLKPYYKNREPLKFTLTLTIISIGVFSAVKLRYPVERLHLLEYGILGWLSARDLFEFKKVTGLFYALIFATCVAIMDETFQYFLPYRVGDPSDVLLGALGAALGISLFSTVLLSQRVKADL